MQSFVSLYLPSWKIFVSFGFVLVPIRKCRMAQASPPIDLPAPQRGRQAQILGKRTIAGWKRTKTCCRGPAAGSTNSFLTPMLSPGDTCIVTEFFH
jgi:hypothetical protein